MDFRYPVITYLLIFFYFYNIVNFDIFQDVQSLSKISIIITILCSYFVTIKYTEILSISYIFLNYL